MMIVQHAYMGEHKSEGIIYHFLYHSLNRLPEMPVTAQRPEIDP